jgi:hypothetical protein
LRSNVSLLSEIAIYTYDEEVKLAEVFKKIAEKEQNGLALSHKESNDVIISYFRTILPDFDEDRVYASDIKKVLHWYNMLQPKSYVTVEALNAAADEEAAASVETNE